MTISFCYMTLLHIGKYYSVIEEYHSFLGQYCSVIEQYYSVIGQYHSHSYSSWKSWKLFVNSVDTNQDWSILINTENMLIKITWKFLRMLMPPTCVLTCNLYHME